MKTRIQVGEKVAVRGEGTRVFTVVDAAPQTRNRIVVKNATVGQTRRSLNSVKTLSEADVLVLRAASSILRG